MAAIDRLLAEARQQLQRVTPQQAAAAAEQGALLVDTRPSSAAATARSPARC
jgi:porphobilinogen deaminase